MQLFELVSPRLFRPLAGPNRAFYAELLLLLWEECRHTADYSISRAEAVSRAEAIKKFRILPEDFTEASGEMTPSLKLKRNKVAENHASEIEAIYA